MLHRLEKEIIDKQLIEGHEKVLMGVSGGPDSIALLHALHRLAPKYQWELFVVHVNHQLRVESTDDALYVEKCCHDWNIPFKLMEVNVKETMALTGGGVQEVARALRYEAFAEAAQQWGVKKIALAHHADDQVETVLLHLIRGTGTSGLMGMQMKRSWNQVEVIRPLLSFTKKEIEAYCIEENLHPREDQSNFSMNYLRNRIRLELLPLLHTYNPNIKEGIVQLSELVKEEEKVWDGLVSKAVSKVIRTSEDKSDTNQWEIQGEIDSQDETFPSLYIPELRSLPLALQRRTIKLILNSLRKESSEFTLLSVEQIRKLALQESPSGQVLLPGGLTAYREYDSIYFCDKKFPETVSIKDPLFVELPSSGRVLLTGMIGEMELIQTDSEMTSIPPSRDWAVFDASQIAFPLKVRTRQKGERMTCYGMEGSKKVKKLLIEEKVPVRLREQYPVIVSRDEEILWIPGVRRSDQAPVDEHTKKFLYLFWHV